MNPPDRGIAERGEEVAHDVADEMREVADEQVGELTDQLRGIVRALDAASGQLHEQAQDSVAEQVDAVADGLARICDRMASGSLRDLADDASAWARENPMGFLGGSVAVGFALSRLIKASRTGEESTSDDETFPTREEGVEHGPSNPIQ
jgi:ElaB/YqjD/DUF883 family membrane-anchored ribosome-binding protein